MYPSSSKCNVSECILQDLNNMLADAVTLDTLKDLGLNRKDIKTVQEIASGEIQQTVSLKGIAGKQDAKEAIEKTSGKEQ
ncbi:hypothetical protein [Francisella tularensis]|uniref:hypothetical protein n=1 Tax=Francisella tularensis TaxID=263 RepID=UPI00168042B0|nr:hypothetical protein [Francisella tularensis]MBD2809116.1 hypothetical protein [Francisella tularensis]